MLPFGPLNSLGFETAGPGLQLGNDRRLGGSPLGWDACISHRVCVRALLRATPPFIFLIGIAHQDICSQVF